MIRSITADEVLPLRSRVLRSGLPPSECRFEADQLPTTFHRGLFVENRLVSILSCQREDLEDYNGVGYRLRGVATDSDSQGKGYGSHLLEHTIAYLADELKADYVWCNARRVAYEFYRKFGFQFLSEEFEIPGIGLHKVMCLALI